MLVLQGITMPSNGISARVNTSQDHWHCFCSKALQVKSKRTSPRLPSYAQRVSTVRLQLFLAIDCINPKRAAYFLFIFIASISSKVREVKPHLQYWSIAQICASQTVKKCLIHCSPRLNKSEHCFFSESRLSFNTLNINKQ